jgi:hypothetical protein
LPHSPSVIPAKAGIQGHPFGACRRRRKFQLQNARICPPMAFMVMILPFLIGLLAALFALRGQRMGAVLAWAALVIVLLAWLQYHASDTLNVSL